MSEDLAQDARWRRTRGRAGHTADEVELFVAAVEDALRASARPDASGGRAGGYGRLIAAGHRHRDCVRLRSRR